MKNFKPLILVISIILVTGCGQPTTAPPAPTATPEPIPTPTPVIYNLKVNVDPEEGGSVSPHEDQFEEGSEPNVYAEPAIGYAFDHWSGDDSSRNYGITVVMDADKEVTAHFVRAPTLVVFANGVGVIDSSQLANALIDFDSDGDLDLIRSTHRPSSPSPVLAYRNDGSGKFFFDTE